MVFFMILKAFRTSSGISASESDTRDNTNSRHLIRFCWLSANLSATPNLLGSISKEISEEMIYSTNASAILLKYPSPTYFIHTGYMLSNILKHNFILEYSLDAAPMLLYSSISEEHAFIFCNIQSKYSVRRLKWKIKSKVHTKFVDFYIGETKDRFLHATAICAEDFCKRCSQAIVAWMFVNCVNQIRRPRICSQKLHK